MRHGSRITGREEAPGLTKACRLDCTLPTFGCFFNRCFFYCHFLRCRCCCLRRLSEKARAKTPEGRTGLSDGFRPPPKKRPKTPKKKGAEAGKGNKGSQGGKDDSSSNSSSEDEGISGPVILPLPKGARQSQGLIRGAQAFLTAPYNTLASHCCVRLALFFFLSSENHRRCVPRLAQLHEPPPLQAAHRRLGRSRGEGPLGREEGQGVDIPASCPFAPTRGRPLAPFSCVPLSLAVGGRAVGLRLLPAVRANQRTQGEPLRLLRPRPGGLRQGRVGRGVRVVGDLASV